MEGNEEIPVWLTALMQLGGAGGVGAAIMFIINQYLRFKKGNQDLVAEATKANLDNQKSTAQLHEAKEDAAVKREEERETHAVAKWQGIAEKALKDASEAGDRANLEREVFDRRLSEMRQQYRDDVTAYQSREDAVRAKWQERELQFQDIIDDIRRSNEDSVKMLNVKIDGLIQQHAECLRENGEMKGRLEAFEDQRVLDREVYRKELEEIRTLIESKGKR